MTAQPNPAPDPAADFARQAFALVAEGDRVPEQRRAWMTENRDEVPKRLVDLAAYGIWVALDCKAPGDYVLCESLARAALRPLVGIVEIRTCHRLPAGTKG